MGKVNEILDGWKNVMLPDGNIEGIAKQRMETCKTCKYRETKFGINVCGVCNCPLIAKTRSLDSGCPKQKWTK